ncbi:SET domain-containing protein [Saitoella complicata NRRL Y-17804]|uniref:SET domain-containing protein n=1 Tax=Saitoella complicata (strain BCRC 22490 / CBS 7301 / JCM 7358 / NBRC 10748 / NRRL Y-17804) TaxID=698492 RepID=UPI000867DCF6|nr:SET domain-containing protein [Saitoella complicata NRRL Y-17804]ODQ54009.1 SET domain-containing protein [Saitoella complicata NRRL Y-17804]
MSNRQPTFPPPANWPTNVLYLCNLHYSPRTLPIRPTPPPPPTKGLSPNVRIKMITDPKHPANGQRGLFAAKKLKKGDWVVDYLGHVHSDAETDPTSDYDIRLAPNKSVDASKMGNEARMVNDYRGVRDRPNCQFETRVVGGEERMAIWAIMEVKKGEELCVSYGKGFWEGRKGE